MPHQNTMDWAYHIHIGSKEWWHLDCSWSLVILLTQSNHFCKCPWNIYSWKLGLANPVLQSDFSLWASLAMDCWLKHLWKFAHSAHIKLVSTALDTLAPQCQGDQTIMDRVAKLSLPLVDLAAFNHCQISHWVYFLSDIMDGWGHSLRGLLLSPLSVPLASSWLWPRASTAKTDWIIWQKFFCN